LKAVTSTGQKRLHQTNNRSLRATKSHFEDMVTPGGRMHFFSCNRSDREGKTSSEPAGATRTSFKGEDHANAVDRRKLENVQNRK
jgi:hypothetical protein